MQHRQVAVIVGHVDGEGLMGNIGGTDVGLIMTSQNVEDMLVSPQENYARTIVWTMANGGAGGL